ncbi:macrophage mannose receptor 1-like [Paramisgurnus dabryanus]|uniref:macrophage mannose receptor 1-like n=1 Tax=Paramisgurnus dabryanus TaxID=90735 RepID=UPI0031F460B6
MRNYFVIFLLLLDLSNCFAQSEGNFLMYSVHYNKCMTNNLEQLSVCDPHADSQQFRWISKDRILNIYTKKCLGVGSKTVGKKLEWLICEDDNVLQMWECRSDLLLQLKNESLYLSVNDNGVPLISEDTETKSQWTIQGTQNNICSRPYEELYTIYGNAHGRPCHFPFKYQDKWYADCTNINSNNPWCAVESDYSVSEIWGNCPTHEINTRLWVKNPLTNFYYQLNDESDLTWHEANKSCQQQGAELLSVSEPYEYIFVSGMIVKRRSFLWTGLNKVDEFSGQQRTNGNPGTKPDDICGALLTSSGLEMIDRPCSEKHGYICQKGRSVPTAPPATSMKSFCIKI